jgi:hypothetical protein
MAGPTVDQPETLAPRRWGPTRVLVTLVVVAMVSMWVYVLYLAFGPGRQDPPDRLDDPTFSMAAQERCREALRTVATLPDAVDTASASDRAAVIDQANQTFAAMLDDLDRLAPSGEDGELVRAWLADWRTYLADREAYATELRADPEARLLVSPKDNQQVTEYLDAFAGDNHMTACATPLDV